ncbi:McrC family protein [Sulfurimonas sp.]
MLENIIYEYQEVKNSDLISHIKDTSSLHQYFKEDWGKLKAKQYCGIINYNGKDFYFLPKIANHDNETNLNIFTYMLMYAYDINVQNEDISNSKNEKSDNILEVFIQLFAKNLFKQLQRGIYKEYITEQDNLTTLKGKYLINENLKYNFTKNKIYCEYDEFSEDNELNRFFLYAIKTLMRYAKNKKLLKHCELALDEVEYKQFNIDNINMHFNRLNIRYKDSFEFALLLLKKSIPMFEKDKKSFAFLFDMNELFEKFIGNIYKNIDITTNLQYSKYFGNLLLKPDIKLQNQIIDTKYKIVKNRDDLKTNDKYQMFVYGTNFEIKNTMLLYPKHNNTEVDEDLDLGKNDKMIK